MLETLDYTIRIGSTPTFLYFNLYLYSAYAAHFVYIQYICIYSIYFFNYINYILIQQIHYHLSEYNWQGFWVHTQYDTYIYVVDVWYQQIYDESLPL